MLLESIVLLTKRRGQIKQAVTKLIKEGCTDVDAIVDQQNKLDFIDTLRSVTAGKVRVYDRQAQFEASSKFSHWSLDVRTARPDAFRSPRG